ncbi:MAG TPA: hypothetical protein VGS41_14935 [Chthonomonadales bacterium]|nr:hypothetical protein [Chthonomonadales bacterium]
MSAIRGCDAAPNSGVLLVGFTASGRAIVQRVGNDQTTSTTVYEVDAFRGTRAIRKHVIALPTGDLTDHLILSPLGDRIAWLMDPHAYGSGANINCVYPVSIIGLSDWALHPIGYIAPPPAGRSAMNVPFQFRWLPDGSGLSFRFRDGLYSVHVPAKAGGSAPLPVGGDR